MHRPILLSLVAAGLFVACSDSGKPSGGAIRDLKPSATGSMDSFSLPLDATLSPDGKTAYFIALAPDGTGAAIYKSAAPSDGKPPSVLASGPPLGSPFGVDITSDGRTLVIADPGALVGAEDRGELFSLSVDGGTPKELPGASGYLARGIVILGQNGADQVFFTGSTPDDRTPGVFRIASGGGMVTVLAKGAPFADPSGIAVTKDGIAYVADTAGQESQAARVLKIQGDKVTVLLDNIAVGFPAGVALSLDEKTLLVSARDKATGTDVVLQHSLDSGKTESASKGIDKFTEPAGLHRAKNADTFIWADSAAGGSGTVFVINPQTR